MWSDRHRREECYFQDMMNNIPSDLITLQQINWINSGLRPNKKIAEVAVREEFVRQEHWKSEIGRALAFNGRPALSEAMAMSKLKDVRRVVAY